MNDLSTTIDTAWDNRAELGFTTGGAVREAVETGAGDAGCRHGAGGRAGRRGGGWRVNQWLKKAVLLSFRLNDNSLIDNGPGAGHWFDKVPSKFSGWDEAAFRRPASARCRGRWCGAARSSAKSAILMPSFVNIGAHVGEGHDGRHLGDGGQLRADRPQRPSVGRGRDRRRAGAAPGPIRSSSRTARSSAPRAEVVAEGVRVGEGAVLSMGVYLGASTKIVDRETGEIFRGHVRPTAWWCPARWAAATASRRSIAR